MTKETFAFCEECCKITLVEELELDGDEVFGLCHKCSNTVYLPA